MLFYIVLDLNNQKILCLPSFFQFERTVNNLSHPNRLSSMVVNTIDDILSCTELHYGENQNIPNPNWCHHPLITQLIRDQWNTNSVYVPNKIIWLYLPNVWSSEDTQLITNNLEKLFDVSNHHSFFPFHGESLKSETYLSSRLLMCQTFNVSPSCSSTAFSLQILVSFHLGTF